MIYHFTSHSSFSKPFIVAMTAFSRKHSVPVIIVYSSRNEPKDLAGRVRLAMERIRRLAKGKGPLRHGLPVVKTNDVNSPVFYERISNEDVGIVTGFNQIFRSQVLYRFGFVVNVHPSVLPLYRGPVPVQSCLLNGEQMTGFTLHKMTEKIDSGEILFQGTVSMQGSADVDVLSSRIGQKASHVLVQYLEQTLRGDRWQVATADAKTVYRTHVSYARAPANRPMLVPTGNDE